MHPDRARRIADDMRAEAAHLRKLAANCKTDLAAQHFLDRAAEHERKADSLMEVENDRTK